MANSHKKFQQINVSEEDLYCEYNDSFVEIETLDTVNIDIEEMINEISHYLNATQANAEVTSFENIDIENVTDSILDNNNNAQTLNPTPNENIQSPIFKVVYALGNPVPDFLIKKIDWNISSIGLRTDTGTLTTIKNGKKIIRMVYEANYWYEKHRLVYADQFPAKNVALSDLTKLTLIDSRLTIEGKDVIKISAYRILHAEKLGTQRYLSDETISPNHPFLDPKNRIKGLDFENIPAVFYRSGKDLPPHSKPCWTHQGKAKINVKGFVEIEGKKFLVRSLRDWNHDLAWHTLDGRKLKRSEYENIVQQNKLFFLPGFDANGQPILMPLRSGVAKRRLARKGKQNQNINLGKDTTFQQENNIDETLMSEQLHKLEWAKYPQMKRRRASTIASKAVKRRETLDLDLEVSTEVQFSESPTNPPQLMRNEFELNLDGTMGIQAQELPQAHSFYKSQLTLFTPNQLERLDIQIKIYGFLNQGRFFEAWKLLGEDQGLMNEYRKNLHA